MEETHNILLNSSINKKSVNENSSLNITLSGNRILLPESDTSGTIDAYNVYINERSKSNKFRLIFNINPYCTNVLFNPFTEIIKNEGSSEPIWLNKKSAEGGLVVDGTIGKGDNFKWTVYDAIRDTQLSNEKCGFSYNCGLDIFNNHILRSKSLKAVNYNKDYSNMVIGRLSDVYGVNYNPSRVNERAYDISIDEYGRMNYTAHTDHFHSYLIEKDFNTIDDYMRDKNGVIISEHFNVLTTSNSNSKPTGQTIVLPLHLYQNYDIFSFEDCIYEKLIEDNGWYGFSNPSNLDSLVTSIDATSCESMNVNKTINNRLYCDFIDMYPGRKLYSFVPQYNEKKKRLEKNWQYFLTYPSKSVIKNGEYNFPFFRYTDGSKNISLKAYMIDEGTYSDEGENVLTVYSICQHGLRVGDRVNIYKSDDLFYESAEVMYVTSKYEFQVLKDDGNMSERWIEFKRRHADGVPETLTGSNRVEEGDSDRETQELYDGVFKYGNKFYPICESNRCNIDDNAQDIHFRRVVNGVECKYYVRKFSRLPNFKFKDEEVNDYTLYDDEYVKNHKKEKDGKKYTLIEWFSMPGNDNSLKIDKKPMNFESHVSKLGFANTSYGDDSVEIVFTDDVDTSHLRDNLGRPLSDVYLTIIKNNKGYKQWYGIGADQEIECDNYLVEYSHCFGKINGSFLLSDYFREYYKANQNNSPLYDVRDLVPNENGFIKGLITETELVKKRAEDNKEPDEIEFDEDFEYYGDICCYSPVDCDEQVIQKAMCRFNTTQRELSLYNSKALDCFNNGTMYHDEIRDTENTLNYASSIGGDPYNAFSAGTANPKKSADIEESDTNLYHTTREEYTNMLYFKEGYYYQPHYRVPIKTVSKTLNTDYAVKYEITTIQESGTTEKLDEMVSVRKLFLIKTFVDNDFVKNEKVVLYKRSTNQYFYVTVYDLFASYAFRCVIADEDGNHIEESTEPIDFSDVSDFVLVKKHYETPYYAKLIKDGSCRYCWREIVSNGIESDDKVYPFTNGAFYITKQVNFFLRRQGKDIYYNSIYYPDYDYVPDEERIIDYPNFNPIDRTNFEPNEIKEC